MLQVIKKITTSPVVHPHSSRDYPFHITMFEHRRQPLDARAETAALYMRDPTVVKPSAVLARYIFRVSIPRIKAAQARLDTSLEKPALESAWDKAAPSERFAFTRNHSNQFLRILDNLTSP